MAVSARHSLVLRERERSCGPIRPVRSWACVTRWRVASRSRTATWTAPPDARRTCRRVTERPSFRLGSSSPEMSQTAPATPSLDARRQPCESVSTSRCFPPGSACLRKPDAADPLLAEVLAVAKHEGFVVAVTDDLVELRPRIALLLRSGRIEQYEQAVLDRLEQQPDSPKRERQHVGTAQQPRTRRRSIPRVPTHEQRKSLPSSSCRTTRSRHTSNGSTKSSGSLRARKRSPKHVAWACSDFGAGDASVTGTAVMATAVTHEN